MNTTKIYEKFKYYGGLSLKYKRKAVELLPLIAKHKIHHKHNFATVTEFAAKLAGISPETTRKILSTYRRTENLPKLRKKIKTVGYTKVVTVLPLTKTEKEETLVKMVDSLPIKALRQQVKDIKTGSLSQKPKQKFTVEMNNEMQQNLNKFKKQLEKEKQRPVTNQEILQHLLNKVAKPEEPTEPPRPNNKTLTPKHKKNLKHKHKGICAFPNCNKAIDHFHHTNRKALNPKPQNIVPLCKEHHQIAHTGTIPNEHEPPNHWWISLNHKQNPKKAKIDAKTRSYWRPRQ